MLKSLLFAAALLPLTVTATAAMAEVDPDAYVVPPSRCYVSTDFAFDTTDGADQVKIAGSFLAPAGSGARPTVLMISGTGGHLRQQMISGVPMIGLLADMLARAGYNVVMTDARGVGASTVNGEGVGEDGWLKIQSPVRDRDTAALIDHLLTRPDVARTGLILMGHSEGAMIAGRLAADRSDIALSVLLSDSTSPGPELFADQRTQAAVRDGATPEVAAALRVQLLALTRFMAADPTDDAAFEELVRGFEAAQAGLAEPFFPRGFLEFHRTRSPFHAYLMTYDPWVDISRITSPVLAIWGGNDDATPAHVHAPILMRALGQAGNDDVGLHVIPNQDHFFLEFEGQRVARHPFGKTRIADELKALLLSELALRFPAGQDWCED